MSNTIKKIVIVGGGTAGWMVAARLSAKYQASDKSDVSITLVESADVKPIGVGEGTWPSMRKTLQDMGISETEFIRECDVTFKQGSKFNGWLTGEAGDHYYHPFTPPIDFETQNPAGYWQDSDIKKSFSLAVSPQESVCEAGLAPKQITTPEYASVANYGYHLNAAKFSSLLKSHCMKNHAVRHVVDNVIAVNSADNGDIASVNTKENGNIEGDLFVDCSGFACLLLGKHYGVPFIDKHDTLFVDTALAVQIPYDTDNAPISSVTNSTATSAGWIWDIGLQNRKGIGHVYSSRHNSESKAEQELLTYLGEAQKHVEIRKIPIKAGHRKHPWQNNCVAIGLSAGFLEPLEASALVQVELSASWLADQLPANRESMDIVAKRFNTAFKYRWERIIDFLKLHYVLSQRTENFWVDNRHADSIPDSLAEVLELWKFNYPSVLDFDRIGELFPTESYQYILSGMGFRTRSPFPMPTQKQQLMVEKMHRVQELTKSYVQNLSNNRDLIEKIKLQGLQKI
ncbi:MAG: tryptophan halogenase [Flavobacteriales bacterium]|jgi:tryptophan halogenase